MKKIFLLPAILLVSLLNHAQETPDPCCHVVGINTSSNVVIGRNNFTGRLFAFKATPSEIKNLKLKDPVNALGDYSLITSLNGVQKKYLPEKINVIRVNNSNAATNSIGIGLVQFNYNKYCCNIISIEKNGTSSLINAVDKVTGEIIQFNVPAPFGETLKIRDPIYKEPAIGMAIVNSTYQSPNTQTFLFSFPIDKNVNTSTREEFETNAWVITPTGDNKTLGRLHTTFPLEVEWGIEIYSRDKNAAKNSNFKSKQPFYELPPGSYDFKLNNVTLENVPIQAGKETRLKSGILKITVNGKWELYDEAQKTLYLSGDKATQIAIPAGKYKLVRGHDTHTVTISDSETLVF